MLKNGNLNSLFIIPFFNEEKRMDLAEFELIFSKHSQITFCLVDDKSTDNTYNIIKGFSAKYSNVSCVRNEKNLGKAESIRLAVLKMPEKHYDYIGYLDADLATPIVEMLRLLDFAISNPNIEMVMGTRIKLLGNQVKRSLRRHYFGRIFATIISQFILKIPVYDTQCGAKIIKTALAKKLFAQPFYTRWLFDVELLLRYKKEDPSFAQKVTEMPLNIWREKGNSSIKWYEFVAVPFQMLKLYAKY